MSICGRVWRYHGSGGICLGYLVVLVGALNSAYKNWINFMIYENCFESQIWSVTTKLQMCNSSACYSNTRSPAWRKQKNLIMPREFHALAPFDKGLCIIWRTLRTWLDVAAILCIARNEDILKLNNFWIIQFNIFVHLLIVSKLSSVDQDDKESLWHKLILLQSARVYPSLALTWDWVTLIVASSPLWMLLD